jgi:hypothetical protein
MRGGIAVGGLLVALLTAGCQKGDPCPSAVLEVRAFEGDPVTETSVTCTEALISVCPEGPQTFGDQACGARVIRMGENPLGGLFYSIYVSDDGTEARAQRESLCDDDGCDTDTAAPSAGWVMFEELEQRAAGRFELEFDDGVVSGAFDSTAPGADAGL